MAKGTKKTPTVKLCNNKVEREAKENKHETKMTSQEHPTLSSPGKPLSPSRNSPLFPIHEENSSTWKVSDTSKQKDLRLQAELQPKQDNSGSKVPKEKTPHEDGSSGAALPNKSEERTQVKVKLNKPAQKKAESRSVQHNRKVTDYYPIRRSSRKCKAELKCEEQRHVDDLIKNNVEDGLTVKYIEGKGRGVFAERDFRKGQFVVEYHGDLIQIVDAKKREAQYAQDPTKGCYMYYFHHLNNSYCVDATKETGRLGRLINHSKTGNCQTRLHDLNGVPHLILVAARDIKAEEELLYDYGDRSKEAIAAHPWLKQ